MRSLRFVLLPALALPLAAACGSRGSLDETSFATDPEDASAAADVQSADVSTSIPDASTPPPVTPSKDAGREAGVVQCAACLGGQCLQPILGCIQSSGCRSIFQCVVTTCLGGGGGPDLACMLGCAGSDPSAAIQVLGVFTCVTQTCGPECVSLLSGLGGLGGGGGFGGGGGGFGGGGGGKFEAAISEWPELMTPVER